MAGSDVFVTFGGDTGALEASLASAKASVNAFATELRGLAKEMQATGQSAESELGQKMQAVGANLAEAKAGVASLKTELKGIGEEAGAGGLKGFAEGLGAMLAPIAEAKASLGEIAELFAAAFAVEKLIEFIKSMGELGEATERTSKILGITTEQVGQLQFAFASTGTNAENLDQMMGRFEVSLSEAQKGTGRVAAGLAALGLSAKELIGIPLDEQLRKIADATSQFADGVNKTAALQALGRGFVELIPLLDEGSRGFDDLKEKVDATNSVLNETATKSLVDMQHGFVELGAAINGAALQAFLPFVNEVNVAVDEMTRLAEAFSNSVKAGADMKGILDLLYDAIGLVESAVVLFRTGLQTIGAVGSGAMQGVQSAFVTAGHIIADIFSALAAGVARFFTALETAGLESLKLLVQGFSDFATGVEKALSFDPAGAKAAFGSIVTDATASGEKIKESFKGVFDFSAVGDDQAKGALAAAMIADETGKKVRAAGKDSADQLTRIWDDHYNTVASDGEKAAQKQVSALNVLTGGKNKALAEQLKNAQEEAAGEVEAAKAAATQQEARLNEQLKVHAITMSSWLQQTIAALDQEQDAVQDAYDKELATAGLTSNQKLAILNKEATAMNEIALQEQRAQEKAAEQSSQAWDKAMNSMNSALTGQIGDVLKGTETIKQAFQKAFTSLATDVLKFFADWALQAVENEAKQILGIGAIQTAQQTANTASLGGQAAASAASAAAAKPGIMAQISADVGEAYAGFAAFLAPLLGPAAPEAAAGLAAQVGTTAMAFNAFDIGAYDIPRDQLAVVHQNELVMPAAEAGAFRSMLEGGGATGGAQGGGSPQFHFNGPIIGTQSWINQMVPQLARALQSYQGRNPSLQGG